MGPVRPPAPIIVRGLRSVKGVWRSPWGQVGHFHRHAIPQAAPFHTYFEPLPFRPARVGACSTRQPNIARLGSGRTTPSLPLLRRVVEALGGELEIKIKVPDEARTTGHGR
jgi:hypothetical protein